jgi:hypothetical protein
MPSKIGTIKEACTYRNSAQKSFRKASNKHQIRFDLALAPNQNKHNFPPHFPHFLLPKVAPIATTNLPTMMQ